MKTVTERNWMLILGVIVALVVAITVLFRAESSSDVPTPVVTQKPALPSAAPSVLAKKLVNAIVVSAPLDK